MSEYQFYDFQAIDRPLDAAAREALRGISSRARITSNSFTNHYEYGDLKAEPLRLLARYFDVYVYVANWGQRQFAMRLPRRLFDPASVERFMIDDEFMTIQVDGEHVIVSIGLNELDLDGFDEGTTWLATLAPLRDAVLRGDLRMFYLLWLHQVGLEDFMRDDAPEPLSGIAPLTGALRGFADFLLIEPDLLEAAAATTDGPQGSQAGSQAGSQGGSNADSPAVAEPTRAQAKSFIQGMTERARTDLLLRLYDGDDPHIGTTLRRQVQASLGSAEVVRPIRSAADLRRAALEQTSIRTKRETEARIAAERRKAEEEAAIRHRRQQALVGRESQTWNTIERLIEQRNAAGYAEAATLLGDLRDIAANREGFAGRLAALRVRHASKRAFIARLDAASLT